VTSFHPHIPPGEKKPEPFDAERIRSALREWFAANGRHLPWREAPTPYAVLVSEFMLQQTQVATVVPFFQRWMAKFPDIVSLAAAEEDAVLAAWQGLGYYSRARNLHAAARAILANHSGQVPDEPETLQKLPGVGAYSAGAIASFAFDRPVATVDANIARVLARIGNIETLIDSSAGRKAVWSLAESLLPETGGRLHTSALMELGALVCTPRRPQCLMCPVREDCRATAPESLPVKAPRRATESLTEHAAWIEESDCILLERQTGKRATGLWKLPALENREAERKDAIFSTVYGFTHHRIRLEVYRAAPPEAVPETRKWFPKNGVLDQAALVRAHRRALEALLSRTA
jgi:A/G-specific adenine glycosylase